MGLSEIAELTCNDEKGRSACSPFKHMFVNSAVKTWYFPGYFILMQDKHSFQLFRMIDPSAIKPFKQVMR